MKINIAILGLGTVGYGVYDIIKTAPYLKNAKIKKILDKDLSRNEEVGGIITTSFSDILNDEDPELVWMHKNCYKYGFILRYPKGKEDITGYAYEQWHFRYVGKELAKELHDSGLTLEEYYDKKRLKREDKKRVIH